MNISYPTIKIVNFDEIAPGEVFGYNGALFMRLEGRFIPYDSEGDEYNAVCLHDGSLHEFNNCAAVEKVITHVEVEYDRKE